MSLTVGIQGASATPATDFYTNVLSVVLTARGWVHIEQMSAATAGTTDVVEVWKSGATTVAGTVHTGCILYVETDNTNARIRIRVSEVYDSAPSGSPASRVKWAASGITTSATSTAPIASYAMADTFGPLFVTPATTAKVGYVTIPTNALGFSYWVGGGASRFLVCNNSGGFLRTCLAGLIETLLGSGDTTSVYLMGGASITGLADPSWTLTSAEGCNVRTSREPQPYTALSSQAGAFCYRVSEAIPQAINVTYTTNPRGALGNLFPLHKFHGYPVVTPAVLHGMDGIAYTYARSHRGFITGMIVTHCPADGVNAGDTISVGGVTYTIIGTTLSTTNTVNHVYAVDGSAF